MTADTARHHASPAPLQSCPVCGSIESTRYAATRDVEYCVVDGEFTFYECRGCGALRIDPVPDDIPLGVLYPPNYYSFSHGLESPTYRVKQWIDKRLIKVILDRLAGNELSVLDVGGGSGWQMDLVRQISPRIARTEVVDIDTTGQALVISRGHHFTLSRVEDFESSQRYDLVLMMNLVEHVKDPVEVLRSIGGLLSTQGVILVKTPNTDSLDARLFRRHDWAGFHCPRHWVLFNEASLRLAARHAGLQCRWVCYTQGGPFWAGSVINLLAKHGIVHVDRNRPMLNHWLSAPLLALFGALDLVRSRFVKTSQMFAILEKITPPPS